MILFNILTNLRVLTYSKNQFNKQCKEFDQNDIEINKTKEPNLNKIVRISYSIFFMAVWIASVGFSWTYSRAFSSGYDNPSGNKIERITEHGETKYISSKEKKTIDILQKCMFTGIPMALLGGFFIHFIVGIKLFPNTSTLKEKFSRRNE